MPGRVRALAGEADTKHHLGQKHLLANESGNGWNVDYLLAKLEVLTHRDGSGLKSDLDEGRLVARRIRRFRGRLNRWCRHHRQRVGCFSRCSSDEALATLLRCRSA